MKISTHSLALLCLGAYARRPPPAWICVSAHARLRVRVYLWSKCWHVIYFRNLLEIVHRLRLISAFCDNFDFFAIFSTKFDDVIMSEKMLTYYIFSESAWDSAPFDTNFSFLRQFWFFFAIFSPKFDDVIIIGFCSYAIPTVPWVIPIH